jgi:hypothetical protein
LTLKRSPGEDRILKKVSDEVKKRAKGSAPVPSRVQKSQAPPPRNMVGASELYAFVAGDSVVPPVSFFLRLSRFLNRISGNRVLKTSRAPLPETIFEEVPQVIEPLHDKVALVERARNHWLLRMIYRALRQEVLGPRWKNVPRFVFKCTGCGREYQSSVETCEYCESNSKRLKKSVAVDAPIGSTETAGFYELEPPDEAQRIRADGLISAPNPDYDSLHLLSSALFYSFAQDDWYWSISYAREVRGDSVSIVPKEVYVEDARFVRPVADKSGRLGGEEFFCPRCYDYNRDAPKEKFPIAAIRSFGFTPPECPLCHSTMLQTFYVLEVMGRIMCRWGRDEIIHGTQDRMFPELFGNPKNLAVIKLLDTISAADDYNLAVYSEGKVGSLITFPGMPQPDIDQMLSEAQTSINRKVVEDRQTGRLQASKKIRTVFLGVKEPPVRLPILEDLQAMQSLEFYKLYVEKVCALHGVTPVFVSIIESGKAGNNPRMQIDVQNRTTREHQSVIEDVINNRLYPLFGITDWEFAFNEIEQRDELREQQIALTQAEVAQKWVQMGAKVTLDEEGELEIEVPEGGLRTASGGAPPVLVPPFPKESESSGALLDSMDSPSTAKLRSKAAEEPLSLEDVSLKS